MHIAKRLAGSQVSAIVAVAEEARRLQGQGISVINLCMGEPDFDSPHSACAAAKTAIDRGDTKYPPTAGTRALKQAVQDTLLRRHQVRATDSQILIANGAKQLLFNVFFATLDPGDEVIIAAPYWASYLDIVRVCGGHCRIVDCGADTGFKLSAAALERNITAKTRWLLLNSPANPTGAVYSASELQAIGAVVQKHPHMGVITDEIYEHLVYEPPYTSFVSLAPQLASRTVLINGLSKAYAMTGWRVGYAYAPDALIRAMVAVQNYSTSGVSTIAQAAATAALNGPQDLLGERLAAFKQRRDFMVAAINAVPGLSCTPPAGAFYLFVNAEKLLGKTSPSGNTLHSDIELCRYLLECAHVAVVPGSAFGAARYFRLSFACSLEQLQTAAQALREACCKLV